MLGTGACAVVPDSAGAVFTAPMSKRDTQLDGGLGETTVSAQFMRLGWACADATKYDKGTDVFAMYIRDSSSTPMMGLQVKSGPSYFAEPDGDRGWWYRENDDTHTRYWLSHAMPHVLVLHNLETQASYWVHVTTESVICTGKGRKIFVPRANTVDLAHAEDFLAVAATIRPKGWEGTVWTEPGRVPPQSALRHDLLTPRLIAPHRNAGPVKSPSPQQAVALLVETRLEEVGEFAGRPATPEWQFVTALQSMITTGSFDSLRDVARAASPGQVRAAAAVVLAAVLTDDGDPDEALMVLEPLGDGQGLTPVDRAWVLVQRARAFRETGDLENAASIAAMVVGIGAAHPADVTATMIGGVAQMIVFRCSDWRLASGSGPQLGESWVTAVRSPYRRC